MISPQFKKELNKLNPEQRTAVEAIEGPVMVIAGPGTGKTQILTLRIANILAKTDAAPENILALTFTEAAAANMRRRLVVLIGSAGYYVDISTFHGFCNRLISNYPENFERIIGSKNINSAGQITLIREIIENTRLKHLKPLGDKFYYAAEILSTIKKLKNEGLTPNEFKKKLAADKPPVSRAYDRMLAAPTEKTLDRRVELATVYQKYQQELARRKLYDFDDMILETVSALQKNQDFLLDLQEKYQYILVDEHQDTNGTQNKVLELLAGYDTSPNLFAVGDEKQAIFRFQGASLENFLFFKKKFPAAKIIELKNNYRSTQNILDASDHLIRHNTAVLSVSVLKAAAQPAGRKIKIAAAADEECFFIAGKIKELIESGSKPQEIAVIYRENKDAAPLAEALERRGIAFGVESDENILENTDIKKINALLAAIHNFPVAEHLAPALHLDFLDLDPLEIYSWLESKKESPLVLGAIQKIGQWKKLSFNLSFPKFFETVIKDSGFLKNILNQADYADKIKRLNTLFNEIKKSARENHNYSLKDYLNYLVVLKEHNLPLQTKIAAATNRVRLMTAHRAKGLEFETVFIIGAYNGHWGNKRKPDYFGLAELISAPGDLDKNEDERRLFYMALTRAKKNIFVTYAQTSAEGREQVPCQFIDEIRPDLKEETPISTAPLQGLALENPGPSLGKLDKPGNDEKSFVREMFLKRGLSPTSLNNYLACPWRFFYVNLLQIPQTPSRHQIYGTAKHYALQKFFEAATPNHKLLINRFAENLKQHPLAPADYQALHQKGKESLIAYHNFYKNQWNYNTVNEFKISGVEFPVGKEKIRLAGKLDKLEILNGTKRDKGEVMVVDYKTSKPQSRNWILGKTKNSAGDYFRQLVFYKLLLDMLPKRKFDMSAGMIDFTESDEKGRFKKETFEITPADLSDLKDLISKSVDEILNLKFWNARCDQKDCEYCGLRELMPKN